MKLKYYLRGLGTGIIITALVMGVAAGRGKGTLSDQEIKERAMELGMVEKNSRVLSELAASTEQETAQNSSDADKSQNTPEGETSHSDSTSESDTLSNEQQTNESDTITPTDSGEQPQEESNSPTAGSTQTEPSTPPASTENSQPPDSTEKISITVNPGDSSDMVSRTLAAAGLVENAEEYDQYLCNNGFARSICVGTYQIPVGSSEEEIAKIVTKKK